jgi:hypothetical protein
MCIEKNGNLLAILLNDSFTFAFFNLHWQNSRQVYGLLRTKKIASVENYHLHYAKFAIVQMQHHTDNVCQSFFGYLGEARRVKLSRAKKIGDIFRCVWHSFGECRLRYTAK